MQYGVMKISDSVEIGRRQCVLNSSGRTCEVNRQGGVAFAGGGSQPRRERMVNRRVGYTASPELAGLLPLVCAQDFLATRLHLGRWAVEFDVEASK